MRRAPPPARPTLIPGLARVWRGPDVLQLGVEPGPTCVVVLPHPALGRVVDLLDGALTVPALVTRAAHDGVPAAYVHALLEALTHAGVLVPAAHLYPARLPPARRRRLTAEAAALALAEPWRSPAAALQARSAARVRLTGDGPLLSGVARELARAGLGRLDPVPAVRSRRVAVCAEIAAAAPDVDCAPLARDPTVVVHVGLVGPAALVALGHARRRQPHLLVGVRGSVVAVGPLVPPSGGPCLECLDRHRADRDPGWPRLAGQLGVGAGPAGAVALGAGAAYAAGQVLAVVDGRAPHTIGAVVEFDRDGVPRRRRWDRHPWCPCTGSPPTPTGVRAGPVWATI
ncbi:hypothetical protein GCM10010124_07050 [Pilimelia terevasa]|uniref:Bacteriocin biosynthesis cyclodehydratase domain-containing protein n=1 Tax=Pilimelia terevasa TaxID=53372 RepID=A0A8J3BKE5_9ACTN|nr:hypothetical protein GCM10010124_07050 [Pilimelia terevasa]